MPQPSYLPAPADVFHFPKLKILMKGKCFATIEEIKETLKQQQLAMPNSVLRGLQIRWRKCIISERGSGSGRSGSFDIAKLTWARIAARCDTTGERSPRSDKIPPKSEKRENMITARAAYQKHDYPTLENQPKRLINGALSLISIDGFSIKPTRNVVPNNLYLHLAKDGHWQRKWITVCSSPEDLHPQQKSLKWSVILSACL